MTLPYRLWWTSQKQERTQKGAWLWDSPQNIPQPSDTPPAQRRTELGNAGVHVFTKYMKSFHYKWRNKFFLCCTCAVLLSLSTPSSILPFLDRKSVRTALSVCCWNSLRTISIPFSSKRTSATMLSRDTKRIAHLSLHYCDLADPKQI